MKKILYVITKSNWGGAQKYVFELATGMKECGFDVAASFGGTGERGATQGLLAKKLSAAGIQTIFIPSLERNIAWFSELRVLADLIRLFRKEKPDVVHLNSSKVGGTGAVAARIAGIKRIIFTLHGSPFTEARPFYQRAAITVATWVTILLSHQTIVITKKELAVLSHWPLISKKLTLIYNGISTNSSPAGNTKIRDAFPVGSIIVGTIGELHANKNQATLIDAAAKMNDPRLKFAIVGEGEERKNLETLIARSDLAEKIKLFGFMSATEALSNFDIFVLPSIKEGLPYVVLEAGLAGLPVIASDIGGIGEIVRNGKSGILVSPKDVEQIVVALDLLIDEPQKRIGFGENLRKTVLEKFSFQKMLAETKDLYISGSQISDEPTYSHGR